MEPRTRDLEVKIGSASWPVPVFYIVSDGVRGASFDRIHRSENAILRQKSILYTIHDFVICANERVDICEIRHCIADAE